MSEERSWAEEAVALGRDEVATGNLPEEQDAKSGDRRPPVRRATHRITLWALAFSSTAVVLVTFGGSRGGVDDPATVRERSSLIPPIASPRHDAKGALPRHRSDRFESAKVHPRPRPIHPSRHDGTRQTPKTPPVAHSVIAGDAPDYEVTPEPAPEAAPAPPSPQPEPSETPPAVEFGM